LAYVLEKAEVVRSEPHKNLAGAFLGFLHIPAKRFNSGFRVDSRMSLYRF
jgi:hypothetical protein